MRGREVSKMPNSTAAMDSIRSRTNPVAIAIRLAGFREANIRIRPRFFGRCVATGLRIHILRYLVRRSGGWFSNLPGFFSQ